MCGVSRIIAGQYGGGVFVLFYLLFLLVMGVPVLTMELAVGRASDKSAPTTAYKTLEPKGSKLAHPRLVLPAGLLSC